MKWCSISVAFATDVDSSGGDAAAQTDVCVPVFCLHQGLVRTAWRVIYDRFGAKLVANEVFLITLFTAGAFFAQGELKNSMGLNQKQHFKLTNTHQTELICSFFHFFYPNDLYPALPPLVDASNSNCRAIRSVFILHLKAK